MLHCLQYDVIMNIFLLIKDGLVPLFAAIMGNYPDLVELIVESGANLDASMVVSPVVMTQAAGSFIKVREHYIVLLLTKFFGGMFVWPYQFYFMIICTCKLQKIA